MSFREIIVDRERLEGGFPGSRNTFPPQERVRTGNYGDCRMCIGESGVGKCIVGIEGDRLLKKFDRSLYIFLGPLIPGESPFEIKLIGLDVLGIVLCKFRLIV